MIQTKPDRDAFDRIDADPHNILTLKDIVDVFGWPAMELMILLVISEKADETIVELLKDIKEEIKQWKSSD